MPRQDYMVLTRSTYQHRWWRRNMRLGMRVSWLLRTSVNWASRPWTVSPKFIPIAKWEPETTVRSNHKDN